jgi:hypothetical protein
MTASLGLVLYLTMIAVLLLQELHHSVSAVIIILKFALILDYYVKTIDRAVMEQLPLVI